MHTLHTYHIRTYGCQMNELDSELMAGQLERRGIIWTDDEDTADILIFNTCSIRDLAERKVMGKIGLLREKGAHTIIGVTGCMANSKKEHLLEAFPYLDFVLGPNNIHNLNDVIDDVLAKKERFVCADENFVHELDYLAARRADPVKASVSIIRGCNNFCTYCIVPHVRGREASRPPESIKEECIHLVDKGYKEITLLGQNVNSYGNDKPDWGYRFHDLLSDLDAIPGFDRIRFMTSHPVDITRELMEALRDLPSLCEFVHFPLQAGSDRVLKKMHRKYDIKHYMEKVAMLREIVPNVSLGTDIIVGFPTETDEEFEETYNLMKEIEYAVAFIFAYSPRKGTPAARWDDDVPKEVKKERLHRLLALHDEILAKQLGRCVGKKYDILVERTSAKDPSLLVGKTRCWKSVIFPGEASKVGQVLPVNIESFRNKTLCGTPISLAMR
jgi:tRNA-2-methylthio-N6-dimethylallyladenosine synthase